VAQLAAFALCSLFQRRALIPYLLPNYENSPKHFVIYPFSFNKPKQSITVQSSGVIYEVSYREFRLSCYGISSFNGGDNA
jgi:hypothetical protein